MRPDLKLSLSVLAVMALATPALAQDIRGLEVCTAEKDMVRRTSCLQANVEFLHQALDRHQRDARRSTAAADAENAALKARLAKLEDDMAQLKKAAAAKSEPTKPEPKKP